MPLRSRFFSGIPPLEKCLLSPEAHILRGARGDHVRRIQLALIIVDKARIDESDLSGAIYGATTSQAVLRYKTVRSIINRSYQNGPDDIVGQMTIKALDEEMFARQQEVRPRALKTGGHNWCSCSTGLRPNIASRFGGEAKSFLEALISSARKVGDLAKRP